jgi:hypothetical protein
MSVAEFELEYETPAARAATLPVSRGALRRVGTTAARSALTRGMTTIRQSEFEAEFEGEALVNPIRRVYPDAMMEHFGHAAAEAETEAEAEAFVGALIPLAARLIPRVAPAIIRSSPALLRGVAGITRTLRANPATRPLVRAVPTIVRRTAADINRQSRGGRQVTPQAAVQALARQTQRVLANPQQTRAALRRNAVVDRRYHRTASTCRHCLVE